MRNYNLFRQKLISLMVQHKISTFLVFCILISLSIIFLIPYFERIAIILVIIDIILLLIVILIEFPRIEDQLFLPKLDIGIGQSDEEDPMKAGMRAAEDALNQISQKDKYIHGFGFVFVSADLYDNLKDIVYSIDNIFKPNNIEWIGCTSAGEISKKGVTDRSIVCMVIKSKGIEMHAGLVENVSKNLSSIENTFLKSLEKVTHTKYPSKKLIMFLPGLNVDKEVACIAPDIVKEIRRCVCSKKEENWQIIGASSADWLPFKKQRQFYKGKIYDDALVFAVVFSKFGIFTSIYRGYEPMMINNEEIKVNVTRKDGCILYELNNEPAINVFARIINKNTNEFYIENSFIKIMAQYSFAHKEMNGDIVFLPAFKVLDNGALKMVREVPSGDLILIKSKYEKLTDSFKEAVDSILEEEKDALAILIFPCLLYRIPIEEKMNPENREDIHQVTEELNNEIKRISTKIIGFFTQGEQGRNPQTQQISHFNQSIAIVCFTKNHA